LRDIAEEYNQLKFAFQIGTHFIQCFEYANFEWILLQMWFCLIKMNCQLFAETLNLPEDRTFAKLIFSTNRKIRKQKKKLNIENN
jgi:hypothetical protein